MRRYHSAWCDRMNGGAECNCEAGDAQVKNCRRLVIDSEGPRVEMPTSGPEYEPEWGSYWYLRNFLVHPERIQIASLRYIDPEAK